ncbi:cilia- and flagella-associated protein 61 [Alligator sinensis]|uniref:Cilia- and flagella-associated protein 61 n=1 Tax=Alligator sinensis TaxID=38654 RepID=A0A1U7R8Q0_ALLSI|nr:cilia- and flagella-associated protein 61 [Alligator sinensis]
MHKMTTITSATGTTEVVCARRTESNDIPGIVSLVSYSTEIYFGRINVVYLLEKANLAVTLSNEKNKVLAHAAFFDYPNWNVVDQADWEPFLHQNYSNSKCTPLNTLFMHFFVAKEEYAVGCCQEIIRTVFNAVPELHFILLFIPSQEELGSGLATIFEEMVSIPDSTLDMDFTLFVCHRHQYGPLLYIRKARVEDHDDLMPIFMRHSETLRETYGEYFLAEMIEAQDEDNHAVVCEDNGAAVGFMCVCSQVNIQLLHECFDLATFHGLCKPHPDDVLKLPQEPSIETDKDKSSQTSQRAECVFSQSSECISAHDMDIQIDAKTEDVPPQALDTVATPSPTGSVQTNVSEKDGTNIVSNAELPLGDVTGTDFKTTGIPTLETDEEDAFHPVYRGAVSAFCIQLFCIDEKHEARSMDFLHFIFNLFPDKDFCIITVPHLVPEFLLIQNFVRVVPFRNSTLDQELYVFHRAGLLKSFNVRRATTSDLPAVEMLIKTLDLNKSILDDLRIFTLARRDPDGTPVQAFVAEVSDQIVGVSVVRNEMDIEYIRSHYNIEDFIYFNHHQKEEHGHLYHFALNSIFHHYTKYFLKEILRLAYKSCLYYPIYPQSEEGKFQNPYAHSLTSALHYMVPVRPRRQIVYPLEKLGINAPSKQVSKDQLSYSLNHINRKLTLEPKVSVNARIVVVGASNVGISFLETLIFCPHLKFNNLTLISTHGLPGKNLPDLKYRRFLINSHCFNDKDYALMSLCSWVNVVVGKMTGIDRAAKHVVVSKGKKVPYDHLVLCTGQQYQVPCPTGADISKLLTNREVTKSYKQRYTGKVPTNLFILHDDQDCLKAAQWLKENFINLGGNVIVYGNTIDTYTTVETLLSLGINGSRIHLIQPPLSSNVTCLNNNAIERAVKEALSMADVSVYYDSILAQWNEGSHPDPITCTSFTTNTKPFKLQCSAFLNFSHKGVDYETFKAINEACLVYDGRLVIDTNFHTNDITIRAAGPLTKFSNIYYTNEWTHSNFSSKEIGFQLAASILNLFDPTLEPVSEPPDDMDRLIPMYKGCKIQGGVLPGGYNYLYISKPGTPTRLDVQITQLNYGMEIITGEAIRGNYFRIHINQYGMVETITCFSKKPFPVSNYICLFGQHERVLNNLCSRWKEGLISDLYSYFSESWSLAIYHDRFIDLKKELRQILTSKQGDGLPSLEQLACKIVDGELHLSEKPKKYLKRFFQQSIYKKLVEESILSYLNYNRYHLPMYAWPGIV